MQRDNNGLGGDRALFPVAARSGSMREGYIANLNAQQQDAVEHDTDRPLLIIAGAGSGKTNTLAHRVAHLIALGADPRQIMLLTFSRPAAAEMQRRVELLFRRTGVRWWEDRAGVAGRGLFTPSVPGLVN